MSPTAGRRSPRGQSGSRRGSRFKLRPIEFLPLNYVNARLRGYELRSLGVCVLHVNWVSLATEPRWLWWWWWWGRKPSAASIKTKTQLTYHLQDQLRPRGTPLWQTSLLWSEQMQPPNMTIILIYAYFIQMALSHFTAL